MKITDFVNISTRYGLTHLIGNIFLVFFSAYCGFRDSLLGWWDGPLSDELTVAFRAEPSCDALRALFFNTDSTITEQIFRDAEDEVYAFFNYWSDAVLALGSRALPHTELDPRDVLPFHNAVLALCSAMELLYFRLREILLTQDPAVAITTTATQSEIDEILSMTASIVALSRQNVVLSRDLTDRDSFSKNTIEILASLKMFAVVFSSLRNKILRLPTPWITPP